MSQPPASLREWHWTVLILSLAVTVLAFLLQVHENGRVSLFGDSRFILPELCGSRVWLGVECPACGLTRSFIALADGNVAASLQHHWAGWLAALAMVVQIPYRVLIIRTSPVPTALPPSSRGTTRTSPCQSAPRRIHYVYTGLERAIHEQNSDQTREQSGAGDR